MAGVFILETNQTFSATKIFSLDWTNETQECVNINAPNINGKYVLFSENTYSYLDTQGQEDFKKDVKSTQDRGAIGVLWIFTSEYVGMAGLLLREDSDIVIPVAELSKDAQVMYSLVKNNNSIHVKVISDPNQFIIFVNSIGKKVYQAIMISWWLGISILCGFKLNQLIQYKGFSLNLANICLILELCSLLLHILEMIMEPMRWNDNIPVPYFNILNTIFYPFEMSVMILMIFFWLDMANLKIEKSNKLLGRFQNVSIAACCLIFLMEITLDILSAIVGLPDFVLFLSVIYTAIGLVLAIFYHVAGIKLWLFSEKIMRRDQMRKVTIKVQFCGLLVIITSILSLAQAFMDRTATQTAIIWGFIWFTQGTKSIVQILIFGTPKQKHAEIA